MRCGKHASRDVSGETDTTCMSCDTVVAGGGVEDDSWQSVFQVQHSKRLSSPNLCQWFFGKTQTAA